VSSHHAFEKVSRKVEFYCEFGRHDAAERALLAFLEQWPDHYQSRNSLGVVYYLQSKFELALLQFEKSLVIAPDNLEGSLILAAILADLGCYDQAKDVFGGAQSLHKSSKNVKGLEASILTEADAYKRAGQTERAIQEYEKVLGVDDKHPEALLSLAKLCISGGQLSKARDYLNTLKALQGDSASISLWFGILEYKSKNFSNAQICWDKAKQMDPNSTITKVYAELASSI